MSDSELMPHNVRVRHRCCDCNLQKVLLVGVCIIFKVFIGMYVLWPSTSQAPQLNFASDYFREFRKNLLDFLDDIEILIKPLTTACQGAGYVRLVVLVASAPPNAAARHAIRRTWGKHLPTFFVIGLTADENDTLKALYIEATSFSDMVVYDFVEQRANQTLKTALMLRWARRRCPHAGAVFRTRDDVLVNPWAMDSVLKTHPNADLIGYQFNNSKLARDENNERLLPSWLYFEDRIPEYLSGTGYIIKGKHIEKIIEVAEKTPLHNLEDVFFTYDVAKVGLGLTLEHDRRLSPYKPRFAISCAYWSLASMHSLTPDEMVGVWSKVEQLAEQSQEGDLDCGSFSVLSETWLLF